MEWKESDQLQLYLKKLAFTETNSIDLSNGRYKDYEPADIGPDNQQKYLVYLKI